MGFTYLLIFCYISDARIQDIIEYSIENLKKISPREEKS
jgi:hypothetical protein